MPKLRALTLLHELSLTGAPKIALDACEALRGDVEPFFLSLWDGPLSERCSELGPLRVPPQAHRQMAGADGRGTGSVLGRAYHRVRLRRARAYFAELRTQIAEWKPDLLYINSVASLELLGVMDLPGVPALLHVHELDAAVTLLLGDGGPRLTARPSRYVAVARPVEEMLVRRFGVAPDRVSLIHEFVPDAYLQASAPAGSVRDGVRDARFVVGGAGHPGWRKGATLWLQMAAELRRTMGPDRVRFVWVGTRDDQDGVFFKEEARKRGLSEGIEFVPVTKTPLDHYAEFDVFAMTSLEDPCPLVVLEAMILQVPVLCFAGGGGAPEEVGETGIVIDDFSPAAMASAVAALAADPDRRRALGAAARARVGAHFVASRQAPKLLAEMRRVTEPTAEPAGRGAVK